MPAIGLAISTAVSAFTSTALGTFLTQSIVGRLLTSVALSALQTALVRKPRPPGIKTNDTAAGGMNPVSFIIGKYATAGYAVCPAMTHGKVDKTPNAYMTYVINLGDIPGMELERLCIDGIWGDIDYLQTTEYGNPIRGRFYTAAWVKYYDGTQTVADPMLLAKYGSYRRPWTADMVGTGVCYAIVTFRYNPKLFRALPKCLFEMSGIPLYDPRKDSSVGGSGSMRWANKATWVPSSNPAVQTYNILRGIELPYGAVWGGEAEAADIPLADAFAAMNACDVAVPLTAGGTEPAYRTGFEIGVDDEPATIISELMAGCAGKIVEAGGFWKMRVGGPGLPVYFFSDDDVVITDGQSLEPFPSLDRTHNAIHASYPEPANLWQPKDAPPRYNTTWEAEDKGRRLVAELQLNAVPYSLQVQRVMRSAIQEERRFRQHSLTLPPDAALIEPLDAVAWTSARNGYTAKVFQCEEGADSLTTLLQRVTIRERDASDYDWVAGFELPTAVVDGEIADPLPQYVPGFNMVSDSVGTTISMSSRPALRLLWDGDEQDDVIAIKWEVRLAGSTAVIISGSSHEVAAGQIYLSAGVLPATSYEGRVRFVARHETAWTGWQAATTATVFLGVTDFDQQDFSGNLIPNGELSRGDFRTWTNVPASFSIQPRVSGSPAPALANMPTPFCLRASMDAALAQARITKFDCKAGDSFGYSFAVGGASTGGAISAEMWLLFYFYDVHGALASLPYETLIKTDTTWETISGTVTAPLFATECLVAVRRSAGGSGNGYMTNIEVTKQRSAKATLKAKSLSRNEIATGAISDLWQQFDLTSQLGSSVQAVSVSVDLGAVPRGSIYKRGITFEARNPGYVAGTPTTHMTVTLQRRFRVLGGVFSAWEGVSDFTIDTTVWDVYASSATLAGSYDDFEYRVVWLNNSTANNAVAVLRNVYLTVINVAAGID